MADINAVPLQDYGSLATSFQQGLAAAQLNQANAQRSQAEIPLLQQQAVGANLQNQLTGLQLPLRAQAIQGLMQDQSGAAQQQAPQAGNAGQTAQAAQQETVGDTDVNPDTLAQHAYDQFAPVPTAPPPALMAKAQQYVAAGMSDQADILLKSWQANVDRQNQTRALSANEQYRNMAAVANSGDGTALATLDKLDPGAAAAIQKHYENDTPEQMDKDVRDYATAYAGNAFRYSGRKAVADTGGVMRDEQSGEQVVGLPNVGMSAKDKQELVTRVAQSGTEVVTIGRGLNQPKWQAEGYPSLGAFVQASLQQKGADPGQYKPTNAQPASQAGAPAPLASAQQASQQAASNTQTNLAPAKDQLTQALGDTSYRYKPPAQIGGNDQVSLAADKETAVTAAQNYQKNANDLKTSADEVTQASARSLQYFQAAQQILNAQGAGRVIGIPGAVAGDLARFGLDTDTAAHRAEAAKYLTQAALQGLKTTYGSKPAMFDVKVNLDQAFPEIKEGTQGLKGAQHLIQDNIRAMQYDLASGQRARAYLNAGNDPANFNKWNEQYFQRAANVNAGPGSGTKPPATADASGFIVGRQYKDKNGATATYGGNGQWQ